MDSRQRWSADDEEFSFDGPPGRPDHRMMVPAQNSQRSLAPGGGRGRGWRGNDAFEYDVVDVSISYEELEMLRLLKRYRINRVAQLQQLIESGYEDKPQVAVSGANAFALASGFSISGGNFSVSGRDQHVITTRTGNAGMMESREENAMFLENSGAANAPRIEGSRSSQHLIANQPENAYPTTRQLEYSSSEAGPISHYNAPASRNPFANYNFAS
ncbi:hypothetical protein GYMLUDRAFT_43493 [Collybiopsis luxurians FD-317 M1]|uniref:Uncharacterized protein n=1 Tax=Collybiopsis luxurians FD-317 M1 TaxID=944289 RepID=A0A0D0CXJ0_9AGAR|nr:hypothetical protein GYMLUDRAFT_43493 [Collybiopsis luxurians FD-317 M1]